jgi:hypothetical protein
MAPSERKMLRFLDQVIRQESIAPSLAAISARVEQELATDPEAVLAWEPVPLALYEADFPEEIRSSWVFVLRNGTATGAERHPNSRQRVASYQGAGDLQIRSAGEWLSNPLVSAPGAALERRWLSIPPNVWHQAVVPAGPNWVVVSFHTVPAAELIEERPAAQGFDSTRQRRYLEQ